MTEKNYYDILGVSKKATEDDIKKAYRKLVRQYHPDVSNDPKADEKMGEINNAYETLKDPEKRKQYDLMLDNPFMRGGQGNPFAGGFGGQPNMENIDLEEIFRQFGGAGRTGSQRAGTGGFGGFEDIFSAFNGGTGFGQAGSAHKGEDQHADLTIEIDDSYQGTTKKITINNKVIEVKIPKGISEGQQIRLAKQGNANPFGGENGDLLLKIKFNQNDTLSVDGKNVVQIVNVSPWEASLGGKITVKTPVGKISVNIPKNSKNGTGLRLKGKGIPAKEAGDLLLKLNIVLPKVETLAQEQAWEKLQSVFADFSPNR